MKRRPSAIGLAAFALLACLAVPSTASAQVPCVEVKEKSFTIQVDENAVATPDCVSVKTGKTTLVWAGGANVQSLTVAFKAPALCPGSDPKDKTPEDPACSGARCTLDKAKTKSKGQFCYGITVVRPDGTKKTVDPKLIINP